MLDEHFEHPAGKFSMCSTWGLLIVYVPRELSAAS
ncbi:MAG: hypothetical protein LZF60_80148 [Nitrospira sp.]|nr:MAG: hypothetical protein LZF60_80148 [Nitrospira sp.]